MDCVDVGQSCTGHPSHLDHADRFQAAFLYHLPGDDGPHRACIPDCPVLLKVLSFGGLKGHGHSHLDFGSQDGNYTGVARREAEALCEHETRLGKGDSGMKDSRVAFWPRLNLLDKEGAEFMRLRSLKDGFRL